MKPVLSAVLFDLDGVLVDSVPAYAAAWSTWAHRFGVAEEEIWRDAHGRRPDEIVGRFLDGEARDQALSEFDRLFSDSIGEVRPIDGALSLLESIPLSRWCVVTSARRAHVRTVLESAR